MRNLEFSIARSCIQVQRSEGHNKTPEVLQFTMIFNLISLAKYEPDELTLRSGPKKSD